VDQINLVR